MMASTAVDDGKPLHLAKAIRYAVRHWDRLVVFLDDVCVELGRVEDRRGGVRHPGGLADGVSPPPFQSGLT